MSGRPTTQTTPRRRLNFRAESHVEWWGWEVGVKYWVPTYYHPVGVHQVCYIMTSEAVFDEETWSDPTKPGLYRLRSDTIWLYLDVSG